MFLKVCLLTLLVLQNLAQVFLMRLTQIRAVSDRHVPSTAIFMTEVVKAIVLLALLAFQVRFSLMSHLLRIVQQWSNTVKYAVPALCFCIQTQLLWLGISLLDAPTYMITGQLKISLTALFAIHLLGVSLSAWQKISLVILQTGVILVQVSQTPQTATAATAFPLNAEMDALVVAYFTGIVAVIASCTLSAFASVYFERMLKSEVVNLDKGFQTPADASVFVSRQLQLCFFALLFTLLTMLLLDGATVREEGILAGYDEYVWAAVVNSSLGGLLVAAVVKYADNILKTFATSISIVIGAILSMFFFDFVLSAMFIAGAGLVLFSVVLYANGRRLARRHAA
jgi:solute carrier family 35 (UDP-sugar transporter), member A1/2/3